MEGLGAAPLLLLMTLALAYMATIGEADEHRKIDICTLPPEKGVCRMYLPRYFYNATSEQCEEFVYGGCRGNLNRFRNKTTCEDFCSRPVPEAYEHRKIDVCTLPAEPGPCEAIMPRYFYNSTSEQCEEFNYGGCDGNHNRFDNMTACEAACSRPAPKVCEERKIDICTLPAEPGPCEAIMPRYFYNSTSEQCEEFNYGGCDGNHNRFDNMTACEAACSRPAPKVCEERKIDICTLPAEPGPCEAIMPRYFYNSTSEQCEEFNYGGCDGNHNRFDNMTACEAACSRPAPKVCEDRKIDVCTLPAEPGRCKAIMPRYFYNSKSEQCEEFNYGGCGGNPNRFDNMTACEAACSRPAPEAYEHRKIDVCTLPAEPGRCLAIMPRYFYNSKSEQCEEFNYGGCGGNPNRFDNMTACEAACSPKTEEPEPLRLPE